MASIFFSRGQDYNPNSVVNANQSELNIDINRPQVIEIAVYDYFRFNANGVFNGENAFFDKDRPADLRLYGPGAIIKYTEYSYNADFSDLVGSLEATGGIYGDVIRSGLGNDLLKGGLGDDQLEGGGGDDNLQGEAGDDFIFGGDGADRLNGGTGIDAMLGGRGNDIYYVDNVGDSALEIANQGTDTIITSISWTLSKNFENLEASGSANIALTGNQSGNFIVGNVGSNVLDGGEGADFLAGLAGNDRYYLDNTGDRVRESSGEGVDTVYTSVDFGRSEGSANVETIVATKGGLLLQADGGANRLYDFATGAGTTMSGGSGNDTYYVSNAASTVVELPGNGNDTVFASTSYTLGDGQSIEVLRASGTQGLTLTGNALTQRIMGGAGDDVITGGGGADVLIGGGGNDTFVFRATSESTSAVRDRIQDFTAGDRIDLSQIVTGASDGDFHFVEGATQFGGTAGELIALQRGTVAVVQGDTNGDGVADLVVSVATNGVTLHESDFLLIA